MPKKSHRGDDGNTDIVGNNSIFPIDNYELIYGDWEKQIIWDCENMDYLPKPKDFRVNPNDEKLILEIPEDPEPRMELKGKVHYTTNKPLHLIYFLLFVQLLQAKEMREKNKREIFKRSKEVLRNVGVGQKGYF